MVRRLDLGEALEAGGVDLSNPLLDDCALDVVFDLAVAKCASRVMRSRGRLPLVQDCKIQSPHSLPLPRRQSRCNRRTNSLLSERLGRKKVQILVRVRSSAAAALSASCKWTVLSAASFQIRRTHSAATFHASFVADLRSCVGCGRRPRDITGADG